MKVPEIDICPVCGIVLLSSKDNEIQTAIPECGCQARFMDGTFIIPSLVWTCKNCGFKWQEGQFKNEKPNPMGLGTTHKTEE